MKNETAIVNLDSNTGGGTYWVCYVKPGETVNYFDSFGNLRTPMELARYWNANKIYYNYNSLQNLGTQFCGHMSPVFTK